MPFQPTHTTATEIVGVFDERLLPPGAPVEYECTSAVDGCIWVHDENGNKYCVYANQLTENEKRI